jgi:hypothetical protein
MTLRTFFAHIERTKKLPDNSVFCFSAQDYYLLFFYHLFSFFKKHGTVIDRLSCAGNDIASIKALLSTISFSGATIYWLEGFHALSAKKQQELLSYLTVYTGPHVILFFSDDAAIVSSSGSNGLIDIIALPDKITPHEFSMVRFLVNEASAHPNPEFVAQLALYTDHLSLDSACLFAHYEVVVGKSVTEFFSQWVANIIEPTSSLFTLSQHFFSKKRSPFFRQWAAIAELYMPSFWATFWADQIWRAYIFCDLMKKKKYVESKKAQYKLPFSFVNRDWSSYTSTELRNAHQLLSTMDFQLKNGGSEIGLEHFYGKFFDNKFR